MYIRINNRSVEALPGETVIETAERLGCVIPSLCRVKGAEHRASCMVCAVKNCANGQIIPSCTTVVTEGMSIDTESREVLLIRSLSLELLLSDHRADCEAPCSQVCPQGLDIERVLLHCDEGHYDKAFHLISRSFALPELPCDACRAPCEKACRRGTVDRAVAIRSVIKEVSGMFTPGAVAPENGAPKRKPDANLFYSRPGRFSDKEKERLISTVTAPSRCLHCACAGRKGCRLRACADACGIRRPRYGVSSALPVMTREHIVGTLWFEQAKCIRCGLCVYNSDNGFTFKGRGFGMQVMIPEENKNNVKEDLADLCPTGALYRVSS
ncbi:MAG: (2Fe-2S)-binding protein [Proteiniphilum sp.]|jgi:predicted molibdopterin-dependent oxidoreductase YjgC|nr:(2Fe-2S)-binding protein [Proteiniphilum sp.]